MKKFRLISAIVLAFLVTAVIGFSDEIAEDSYERPISRPSYDERPISRPSYDEGSISRPSYDERSAVRRGIPSYERPIDSNHSSIEDESNDTKEHKKGIRGFIKRIGHKIKEWVSKKKKKK